MYLFPEAAMWALVPIAGSVALFTFLAVASWAEQRRKERESYYRYEFRKQLVDAGKMDASDLRDLMQYEQETTLYRARQSSLVGGFVLLGVGAGLLLGMDLVKSDDAALQSTAVFAAALSFVTAFVAILAMMRWLRKQSYTPFVIYRILFGILILWLVA